MRTRRQQNPDADAYSRDMARRAENLEPTLLQRQEQRPAPESAEAPSLLEEVSRLCREWAEADPKTDKRQQAYGTWAQIWAVNARGLFSINLNTGSVWWIRRSPMEKPIGNVREMTGEDLVELLAPADQ
jgi:hypothetical protein